MTFSSENIFSVRLLFVIFSVWTLLQPENAKSTVFEGSDPTPAFGLATGLMLLTNLIGTKKVNIRKANSEFTQTDKRLANVLECINSIYSLFGCHMSLFIGTRDPVVNTKIRLSKFGQYSEASLVVIVGHGHSDIK